MSQTRSQTPGTDVRVAVETAGLFETPVVIATLQDAESLLQDLEASIRARKQQDRGVNRSNIGSWHSTTDMLAWGGTAAAKLAETAVTIARRRSHFNQSNVDHYIWTVRMWANVTPHGGFNDMHVHSGNLWAAVLYLDLGGAGKPSEDVGGGFYVEDPRYPMNVMHMGMRVLGVDGKPQATQRILPVSRGTLLVFPAWLRHGVRIYTGQRERISVAMNIDAQPKRTNDER